MFSKAAGHKTIMQTLITSLHINKFTEKELKKTVPFKVSSKKKEGKKEEKRRKEGGREQKQRKKGNISA
jgi:hypothetical protein